ncbi:MAG: hypothetical protein L0H64_18920, partial [Pseudonocardia sp.]|nr:hypothetical protein [Pseudonocardia sp.]
MDDGWVVLIAIVAAIAAYVGFLYLSIVFVVAPAAPFVVLAGAAAGVLVVVGVLVGTLLQLGTLGATTVTPFDVRKRLPKPKSRFERDSAWPNYLFAQSRTDLTTALDRTTQLNAAIWLWVAKPVQQERAVLWVGPLLLLPLGALVSMTVAAVAGGLVVYAVVCGVLGIAWIGWVAVAGVLRTVDFARQRIRGAKATCHHPGCNHRNRLPAYRCACNQVHHDIRAGRLGAFVRRCECGKILPTTVFRAAALTPICQKCGEPLRPGAAMLTDVVVPVFGPTSAGKTRLVYAGMIALARHLAAAGGSLRAVGPESEKAFADATAVVSAGEDTAKTAAGRPPIGVTARLTIGRRRALLHLFDAAGEFYGDREQVGDLPFLDDAEGFVFVLDPFSIPEVRRPLTGALADRLAEAHPASMNPEQSYRVTLQWLRDQGVKLGGKPLAVAVVKADLLLDLPSAAGLQAGAGPDEIATWLRGKDLDNMLD